MRGCQGVEGAGGCWAWIEAAKSRTDARKRTRLVLLILPVWADVRSGISEGMRRFSEAVTRLSRGCGGSGPENLRSHLVNWGKGFSTGRGCNFGNKVVDYSSDKSILLTSNSISGVCTGQCAKQGGENGKVHGRTDC